MSVDSFELVVEKRVGVQHNPWLAWVHSELFDYSTAPTLAFGETSEEARDRCLETAEDWCKDFREFLDKVKQGDQACGLG